MREFEAENNLLHACVTLWKEMDRHIQHFKIVQLASLTSKIKLSYTEYFKKKNKKKKSRPMLFRKPEEFSKKFEYFFHDCKLQFIPNILMSRT